MTDTAACTRSRKPVSTRKTRAALLAVACVLAFSSTSRADSLDLMLQPYPDIMAYITGVSYDAVSGQLTTRGTTQTRNLTGTGQTSFLRSFEVLATLNPLGQLSGPGSMKIGGNGGADGTSPVLASTSLLGFGFSPVGGLLNMQFIFGSPTGLFVPTYYKADAPVGVLMSGVAGFGGDWSTSWSYSGTSGGVVDVAPLVPVPEPSTLTLMLLGAGGGIARAVRKRRATRALSAA